MRRADSDSFLFSFFLKKNNSGVLLFTHSKYTFAVQRAAPQVRVGLCTLMRGCVGAVVCLRFERQVWAGLGRLLGDEKVEKEGGAGLKDVCSANITL